MQVQEATEDDQVQVGTKRTHKCPVSCLQSNLVLCVLIYPLLIQLFVARRHSLCPHLCHPPSSSSSILFILHPLHPPSSSVLACCGWTVLYCSVVWYCGTVTLYVFGIGNKVRMRCKECSSLSFNCGVEASTAIVFTYTKGHSLFVNC